MTTKPRTKITTLADHAYNAMHCPDEANRVEAVTELLAGLGINGRRVAEHLGLVMPKRTVSVDGQTPFPWPRDHAAEYRKRQAKARARGTTLARQYPRRRGAAS